MTDARAGGPVVDEAIATRVNTALSSGLPLVIAYVNASMQPRLSFRGSVHVHSSDQLAIWVRDPTGGLLNAIGSNPKVTLMYRDPATCTTILFYGSAHAEDDAAVREAVYSASPEPEQMADPEKKGKPVIVDLDQIQGRTPDGPINLSRA